MLVDGIVYTNDAEGLIYVTSRKDDMVSMGGLDHSAPGYFNVMFESETGAEITVSVK